MMVKNTRSVRDSAAAVLAMNDVAVARIEPAVQGRGLAGRPPDLDSADRLVLAEAEVRERGVERDEPAARLDLAHLMQLAVASVTDDDLAADPVGVADSIAQLDLDRVR